MKKIKYYTLYELSDSDDPLLNKIARVIDTFDSLEEAQKREQELINGANCGMNPPSAPSDLFIEERIEYEK